MVPADQRGDWRQKLSEQKRVDKETFGGLGGMRHHNWGRGRGGPGRGPGGRGGRVSFSLDNLAWY